MLVRPDSDGEVGDGSGSWVVQLVKPLRMTSAVKSWAAGVSLIITKGAVCLVLSMWPCQRGADFIQDRSLTLRVEFL